MLCVATLVTVTNDAAAQAGGRIAGKVEDQAGNPIEGVKVTATSPAVDGFKLEKTTNSKGKFVLSFTNAAMAYVVELKKEGYKTLATSDEQAMAEKAALSGSGRAILVYNEGVEAQRAGDLELAAKKYGEAATINPELAAAHTSLAGVAHMQGDYETAAAEAEKALAIDPTDVRAMQLRFDAYRLAGNDVKAEEAAQSLIFNEGVEAYNSGDVSTAISKFQQAADLDPNLVQARLALAKIFFAEGSLSEALARAEEVLELQPDHADALRITYDSALRLGDQETAAKALDGLAASDPQWAATGLYQIAVELYNNDQTNEAVQALERVLEVEPDHARAHYLLGVALFNTGQEGPASDHLRRFIELAPDDPDAVVAKDLLAYAQ